MRINKKGLLATFENGVYERGKLWFTDVDANNLFCFDIKNKTIESIWTIEGKEEKERRLFSAILFYKTDVILIPFAAKGLYRINLENGLSHYYEIENPQEGLYEDYMSKSKFMSAFLHNNTIYMVGATYPAIAAYNLLTNHIEYYSEWLVELRPFFNNSIEKALFRKSCIYNGKIYAPCCKANAIVVFDMDTCKYSVVPIGPADANYSCICFARGTFWIAERHTAACYRVSKDLKTWCKLLVSEVGEKNSGYRDIVMFGNDIYIIPVNSRYIYRIYKNIIVKAFYAEKNILFDSQFKLESVLCFSSMIFGYIYYIDENHVLNHFEIILPESHSKVAESYRKLSDSKESMSNNIFIEKYDDDLETFMVYASKDKELSKGKNQYMQGKVIYNLLK